MRRNMMEMTAGEVSQYAERRGAGCLVVGVCIVAAGLLVAGWLIYLACCRWQALEAALPVAGWTVALAAVVSAMSNWNVWR